MVSVFNCSGRERDILYQLAALDRPNGNDVRRMLAETSDLKLKQPQIYHHLSKLENKGLVESAAMDGRENIYQLSEEGRAALEEYHSWLENCYTAAKSTK